MKFINKTYLWPVLLLILINLLVYSPVLKNGFIGLDDHANIIDNAHVHKFTPGNLRNIFKHYYLNCYVPLTMLTYMTEYHFFGPNPLVFHGTDLTLHILNCLLVFWLVGLMGQGVWPAFLVAVLFGIHPLRVESVAWATERKDVLYAFFFLSGLVSYVYYLKKNRISFFRLTLVFYVLSLLSKGQAIVLPFVLILMDYYFSGRISWRDFKNKISFLLPMAIFAYIGLVGQSGPGYCNPTIINTPFKKMMILNYVLGFYLAKLFWPVRLSCWYLYYGASGRGATFVSLDFWSATFVMLVIAGILVWAYRRNRQIFWGGVFFLGTILPFARAVPLSGEMIAGDRFTYIPSIGLCFLVGLGLAWLYRLPEKFGKNIRTLVLVVTALVILTLSVISWQRCFIWRTDLNLWTDVIKNYPYTFMAYNLRAQVYMIKGKYPEAHQDLDHVISISPANEDSWLLKGMAYRLENKFSQALQVFDLALTKFHGTAKIYLNRGLVYGLMGNYTRAAADFQKTIDLQPDNGAGYYYLAVAKYYLGRTERIGPLLDKSRKLGFKIPPSGLTFLMSQRLGSGPGTKK